MKKHILCSLFAAAFMLNLGCQSGVSSTEDIQVKGPSFYGPEDKEFLESFKLNLAQRTQILTELSASLEKQYVLYSLKETLTGQSVKSVLETCFTENAKHTEMMPRFEFQALASNCLSGIQDSHISLSLTNRNAYTATVLTSLADVDSKYYVAATNSVLLQYLIQQDESNKILSKWLVAGAEILELNEQPVKVELAQYAQKLNEGTSQTTSVYANWSYFNRYTNYAQQSFVRIKLKLDSEEKVFDLPWFFEPSRSSTELNIHLTQLGMINNKVAFKENVFELNNFVGSNWYTATWKSQDLLNTKTYFSDSEHALTTGLIWDENSSPLCYIRLTTFDLEDNGAMVDSANKPFELIPVLTEFLTLCEKKQLPLVFDLKNNPGGNGNLPKRVYQLLATDSKNRIEFIRSFRNTPTSLALIEAMLEPYQKNAAWDITDSFKKAIVHANKNMSEYLPWVVATDKSEEDLKPVYTQKMLTVISPFCVSACEVMSQFLSKAGRSQFIGKSTAGTGAGFNTTGNQISAFQDSLGVLKLNIPNMLFTIQVLPAGVEWIDFDPQMVIENRPIQPDFEYSMTMDDVKNNWKDLKKKINEMMFTKNPSSNAWVPQTL